MLAMLKLFRVKFILAILRLSIFLPCSVYSALQWGVLVAHARPAMQLIALS